MNETVLAIIGENLSGVKFLQSVVTIMEGSQGVNL